MTARIYRLSKSAMQSGRANTRNWVIEMGGSAKRSADPVMGWTSVDDTDSQIRLEFETRELAIKYAEKNKLDFVVEEAREPKRLVKSYAENFATNRKQPWTH